VSGPRVGFVGMSHLGLVSAAAAAAKGFPSLGFDSDADLVRRLAERDLPVREPGLDDLIAANAARLRFTSAPADLAGCDVVYVSADVPTDAGGRSDLSRIGALCRLALDNLAAHASLVVLSQVPPGFTRDLPCPPGRLFYQVETLIFGRAVERAMHPERIIVGCAEPAAPLPTAYADVLAAFACPVLPMRYESAELAKISINCCLVATISTANTLAELCERIGADWSEIAPALRLDRRIGRHAYLSPGLGLAGGNLERDLATVERLAQAHGADASVVAAWSRHSAHRKGWAARTLRTEVLDANPDAAVAVLGLAYKENTHSTKNAPALALIEELRGHRIRVYDPVVPAAAAGDRVEAAGSALAAAEGADAVVLMTAWDAFRAIDPADLAGAMRGRTLLDPWRLIEPSAALAAGLDYITLGAPPQRAARED